MADYRTKPESELTFYAFSQPDGLFSISRYDTVYEAISKFKENLADNSIFSGIGVSRNGVSEADILQKNKDTVAIVTDYKKIESMKYDIEIEEAVRKIAKELSVVWEYTHDILKGSRFSSVCIPCTFGKSQLLHNERIDNFSLKPVVLDYTASSIDKFMIADTGWVDAYEVMNLCRNGEREHPKIESISVKVEDRSTKEESNIEISPNDYLLMAENYVLSNQKIFPAYEINPAIESLAAELNDFIKDFDPYEYADNMPAGREREAIEQIFSDIQEGNVESYITELKSIIEDDRISSEWFFSAKELISRLSNVSNKEIKQDLSEKITNAEKNTSSVSKENSVKDNIEK